MIRHYTIQEIREFIACPQFGDVKYGRWGALRIEVRETLLNLINLVESMDSVIKQKANIIKEVREELLKYENDTEANRYAPIIECLEILDKENK